VPRIPGVRRDRFVESARQTIVTECLPLAFLADAGTPFTLLYLGALAAMLAPLCRAVARGGGAAGGVPAAALLVPLTAALLHSLAYCSLYHPQVSWFFHLLLGLGAGAQGAKNERS
jgi:hypothetical protein